jgi:hypothetical protein
MCSYQRRHHSCGKSLGTAEDRFPFLEAGTANYSPAGAAAAAAAAAMRKNHHAVAMAPPPSLCSLRLR